MGVPDFRGAYARDYSSKRPLSTFASKLCAKGGGGIFKRLQYNTIAMCRHSM